MDHQLGALAASGPIWAASEGSPAWWRVILGALTPPVSRQPSLAAKVILSQIRNIGQKTDLYTEEGLYLLVDARMQNLGLHELNCVFASICERARDRQGLWAVELIRRHRWLGWYDGDTIEAINVIKNSGSWRIIFVRNIVRDLEWRAIGANRELLKSALSDARSYQVARDQAIAIAADLNFHRIAKSIINQKSCTLYTCYSMSEPSGETSFTSLPEMANKTNRYDGVTPISIDMVRTLLRKAIIGKSIAIVGNGISQVGLGSGGVIDGYDVVVRFNNFSIRPEFSVDYGSKTDIVVGGIRTLAGRTEALPGDVRWILLGNSDLIHKVGPIDLKGIESDCDQITSFPKSVHIDLYKEIGAEPSLGLKTIYWLMTEAGAKSRIDLFGFSFSSPEECRVQSSHYFESALPSYRHKWSEERALVRKWHRDNRLTYYELFK